MDLPPLPDDCRWNLQKTLKQLLEEHFFGPKPVSGIRDRERYLDPQTARRLITRFKQFPHAIGVVVTVSRTVDVIRTQWGFFQGPYVIRTPQVFFQGPHGLRMTQDDPGTPVRIKRKLKQISALCEEAGMAAGARNQASALPYWIVLLYNYNPRYFKSASEGVFWMRNLPLASIEYCEQYVFEKPGRPKGRSYTTFGGKVFRDLKGEYHLNQMELAESLKLSRHTIQRRECEKRWSTNAVKNLCKAAQSRLKDPNADKKDKALARELLKRLGRLGSVAGAH
jgi:hypothetical protein